MVLRTPSRPAAGEHVGRRDGVVPRAPARRLAAPLCRRLLHRGAAGSRGQLRCGRAAPRRLTALATRLQLPAASQVSSRPQLQGAPGSAQQRMQIPPARRRAPQHRPDADTDACASAPEQGRARGSWRGTLTGWLQRDYFGWRAFGFSATHSPTTSLPLTPSTKIAYREPLTKLSSAAALPELSSSGRGSAPHWARAAALQRPAREPPRCPPGAPSRDPRMLEQGFCPSDPRPHALPRPPRPPPQARGPCVAPGPRPRLQALLLPGAPTPRARRPLARLARWRRGGAARQARALR